MKILNFMILMGMDEGHRPRCLLWHGWLPMLSGVDGASPWAANASDSAVHLVEGRSWTFFTWVRWLNGVPLMDFDAVEAASLMPDAPTIRTDGSLILDQVTGVSSSGAGFCCPSV